MDNISHTILEYLRKTYTKMPWTSATDNSAPTYIDNADVVAKLIIEKLSSDKPCMIARFGNVELDTVSAFWCNRHLNHSGADYITGRIPPWWWTKAQRQYMQNNAGFFNPSDESLERFSKLMISDMPLVDILGSWLKDEVLYSSLLSNADKVRLRYLEPFWSEKPWTSVLKGKKILVVHPFSKTIEQQYEKRASLFDNADVLPTFASLQTIKAVQSIGNESNGFKTWFNALEYMEKQIDASDFDIALIGCGAYGFPLAAHVKRLGKKAVHMGGSLQLLFGIKGKRWFDPSDVAHYKAYHHLLNSNWVNPDESEKPAKANNVEGGCYW